MNRVFVYGTLKRGQRNNHFLRDAEFVSSFSTKKIYSMYEFENYPAVCLRGRHAIEGEIYLVCDHQFQMLDELEWYPHFYQRIEIPTTHGDAWMYIVKHKLCLDKKQLPGIWPWSCDSVTVSSATPMAAPSEVV
ncbi:MAG: gamma-glutamylcyclotransferase [Gammaproteobacteria bacterium]|nr:gamma-glutamylcyclotransferase [Gammaproteobacteria bacterium]